MQKEEQSHPDQAVTGQDVEDREVILESTVQRPADQAESSSQIPKLTILCDECKQDIGPLQTKQKKLKKGFLEIGLSCPHCGFWVHSYYTNPELEQARKTLANFEKNSRRSSEDRQRYEQKLAQFKGQYRKIQERAKALAPVV